MHCVLSDVQLIERKRVSESLFLSSIQGYSDFTWNHTNFLLRDLERCQRVMNAEKGLHSECVIVIPNLISPENVGGTAVALHAVHEKANGLIA